jgi:hypothetical protein
MLPTSDSDKLSVNKSKPRSPWVSAARKKAFQRFVYDHWLQLTTFAILLALLALVIVGAMWTLEHHSPKRMRLKNKRHAALAKEWREQQNRNPSIIDAVAEALTNEMTEAGDLE